MNSERADDRSLGLEQRITRRDFLNGSLLASGAAVLSSLAPIQILAERSQNNWDGYGGVGDYKNAHGNPWEVLQTAHQIRDGAFDNPSPPGVRDTGEVYDLVIVGGGSTGLGAAYFFQKGKKTAEQRCLILESHPVFGGEAKQNEFLVGGQRLIGPQGAWRMAPEPDSAREWMKELYRDIQINQADFHYQNWDPKFKKLEFDRGFDIQVEALEAASFGYFFDQKSHGVPARWVRDFWGSNMNQSPFSSEVRRDLSECKFGKRKPRGKEHLQEGELNRWLDNITYQDYLERFLGLHPEVTRFMHPLAACVLGLGADAISAYRAVGPRLLGFQGLFPKNYHTGTLEEYLSSFHAFPGGNTNCLRHIVKFLIPKSIGRQATLEDIHSHPIRFEALDRPENPTRIRLHTTVVRVEHLGKPENAEHVQVTYSKGGMLWRLRARAVVMAVGGWVNRRVVRDLPGEKLAAFQQFLHSSMLVVNVAVTNWRFLYKLGLTGGRWFDGFGYFCNLRQQMVIGDYRPKLDPNSPNILTFYVPFYAPGKPASEQVALGRAKLFSTSFLDYERQIRGTLARVFSMSGFNPKRDIAGIVLNRWGHSVVVPVPGFMFGRNGEPAAWEIAWKPFGRIGFAHSELQGGQSFGGAISHARRATSEVLDRL